MLLLRESLADESFIRLVMGAYRGKDTTLRRIQVRSVLLRAGPRLSFVWSHATRDVTKNHVLEDGIAVIFNLIQNDFDSARLETVSQTWHLELKNGIGTRLSRSAPVKGAGTEYRSHDQPKQRAVRPDEPWLRALGVTGQQGEIRKGMESKYRQIHRFIELTDPLWEKAETSKKDRIRICDMGCGKGYLTFATYFHLRHKYPGRTIEVIGLEARPELAAQSNRWATQCGADGLRFESVEIAQWPIEPVTGVIALHACDTATDDALYWGIQAGASWLVCSPCCHRELRSRLVPPPALKTSLRHGIFAERHAEFLTDAIRAALLEWMGYESRVFEFISPEHTAKNLMITGIRKSGSRQESQCAEAVRSLAGEFGIQQQHLAERLGFPWERKPAP